MKSKLINSEKVTFVLTSCGRTDLLDPTLESFFSKNNYPLHEMYLVEDSVDEKVYKHVKEKWGKKLNIICNKKKKGQIQSIIDTYKLIKTPYIFHCEDDWVYLRDNFIDESLSILKKKDKAIQIWMESKESANRLPIFSYGKIQKINNINFRRVYCKEGWEWGYFSFRPGLKRLSDYELINGYKDFKNEIDIGVRYKKLNYYTLIFEKPAVEDIGIDRTIFDPTRKWPKRRKTNAPTGLKRLWRHLKKLKFSIL